MAYSRRRTGPPYELAGSSAVVRECVALVERAAGDDRNVLIAAEPGLDAAAAARAIHQGGPGKHGPFVVQTCAALSAAELEQALFGSSRRTSAGDLDALAASSALFRARGGMLFLTDLDELPAPLQQRLARLLRDGEVRLPRRWAPVALDVRVIASTTRRLDPGLREDLIRRLPVVIEIPSFRQRRDDLPAIAGAMLAARDRRRRFTPAALTVLSALPWRRNTAELAGLIDRLAATGRGVIRQEDVLGEVQLDRAPARPTGSLRDARRAFEREFIAAVLRDHSWQMREAARALGIERANLYRKARQLGIPLRREGNAERRGIRATSATGGF
jgi:DNA-binding NtrC family response regulator